MVGDYSESIYVRGKLHLRLNNIVREMTGVYPLNPAVLLDQQRPLPQPAGSKVVTRRVYQTAVLALFVTLITTHG